MLERARRASDGRYGDLATRFRDALLTGNANAANDVADAALAVGHDVAAVQARVITAMRMIGDAWEQGAISVADEHLATAISHEVAARLFGRLLGQSTASRERVMLAAAQGEHHILGLRMVADVLEGAGYEVLYRGPRRAARISVGSVS